MSQRLDGFQQRHPVAGFPLAVIYKFVDDQGSYLTALITYYGFLSVFPLLLLFSSILGILLRGHPDLQHRVLHSALSQFPIISSELVNPAHLGGRGAGLVIGVVVAIYGGLGVAQAGQHAMNVVWAVPRNNRPNPFKGRGRSAVLLAIGGPAILLTMVLSAVGSSAGAFGLSLGVLPRLLLLLLSVVVNTATFAVGFRFATARSIRMRDLAPGALIAAFAWQFLQAFGTAFVGHVVKGASAIDGVVALVLGLMAFIYLSAAVVVLSAEVNVVRVKRLYPRSLLSPFTDQVNLTDADKRTYRDAARAQRHKGFQQVDVDFSRDGQHGDE